jgi:hypothetical protein
MAGTEAMIETAPWTIATSSGTCGRVTATTTLIATTGLDSIANHRSRNSNVNHFGFAAGTPVKTSNFRFITEPDN